MSIKSGIYQIKLILDGRIYIGSSHDIASRWTWHRGSTTQLIGKMIKKYGVENFEFSILEECDPLKEVLEQREQWYLDSLKPFPWCNNRGFNLSPTAYTPLGIKRSDATRQKMRNSWHQNRGPEYFKALSDRVSGDNNPAKRPEVREKISKVMTGRTWNHDLERVEKHRKRMTEWKRPPELIRQIAEKNRGSKRTEVSKAKMSAWQQRCYQITSPTGACYTVVSKDLKKFCKDNGLGYPNLQATSRTGKPYKGWQCILVDYPS